jgi:hypothetical protein
MKKILVLILFIQLFSCEKIKYNVNGEDSYLVNCADSSICHLVIQGKPGNYLISLSDLETIRTLFDSNKLSLDNFVIKWFLKDDLEYFHVGCHQYINNLNIFSDDVIFHFDPQGHYISISGEIISYMKVRSVPSLCIGRVIELFLQNVENDGFYSRNLQQIKDGCISCELGYWDLNSGISYADQNFTLAWRIKPFNSYYPWALINDMSNSLIFYDNGIRY